MEVLHTLCVAVAAIGITGLIVWGASSCSQQDATLRESCIRAGGSVVSAGMNGSFHCLRTGTATAGQ